MKIFVLVHEGVFALLSALIKHVDFSQSWTLIRQPEKMGLETRYNARGVFDSHIFFIHVSPSVFLKVSRLSSDCYQRDEVAYRFYCPSASVDSRGERHYRCISHMQLCNNIPDCPHAEDENRVGCIFYEAVGLVFGVITGGNRGR